MGIRFVSMYDDAILTADEVLQALRGAAGIKDRRVERARVGAGFNPTL
jgi:hypothetical protein